MNQFFFIMTYLIIGLFTCLFKQIYFIENNALALRRSILWPIYFVAYIFDLFPKDK